MSKKTSLKPLQVIWTKDSALSATAVNKQTVNVATMMLDSAKTRRDQAMQNLEKIGQKRKLLTD